MAYNPNGILSIRDHKGRYIGNQTLMRAYLRRIDIDITTMGPEQDPTAIVLALSNPKYQNQRNAPTTYIKADYFKNCPMDLLNTLMSKACSCFRLDELHRNTTGRKDEEYERYGGSVYYIYFNNGVVRTVSKEEFYQEACSFEYVPEEPKPESEKKETPAAAEPAKSDPVKAAMPAQPEQTQQAESSEPVKQETAKEKMQARKPDAASEKRMQEAIQTGKKNRRDALIGSLIGIGISIVMFLIAFKLLG